VGAERGVVGALAHWVLVRGAYETRALRPRVSARGEARSKAKDDEQNQYEQVKELKLFMYIRVTFLNSN
jgi:hypothetical protein